MTYDSQLTADWQTALAEIRDKVGGQASWTILDDALAEDGYFVLGMPNPFDKPSANEVYIGSGAIASGPQHASDDTLTLMNGSGWDSAMEDYTGMSASKSPAMESIPAASDSCQYWVSYRDDRGFVAYLRRNLGDGSDGSVWFGSQLFDDFYWNPWSPGVASEDIDSVGYFQAGYGGSDSSGDNGYYEAGGNSTSGSAVFQSTGTDQQSVYGILNPDANYNNYVWGKGFIGSNYTSADTGESPLLAEISDPMWLEDRSGSAVQSGDVVQDSGGVDQWEIVDYHDNRVALRMI